MVSIGLSATDSLSVEQASMSLLVEPCTAEASSGETVNRLSNPAMQIGSVGALVVLGVLGTAGAAQATVRRGAQCEAVDQLQVALGDRGYDVGGVDGKFGGRTEAAVRLFQQQQKLAADGIVGPATAQAMGLPPEFSCSFVAAQAVQEPVAWSPEGEFAVVTNGGALRLRKAPAGPVVGALKNGDRVTVIKMADGWARLSSGAWVSQAWLRVGRRLQEEVPQKQQPIAQSVPAADVSPGEKTLATAIPGQVVELPSSESTQLSPQAAVEPQVVAVPPKTGKIAVSLPKGEPAVETRNAVLVERVVSDEPTLIQAVAETATAGSATMPASVNQVSAPRLDLEPGQINSRALLVAAASDSISLPSAIAPESTPLNVAEPSLVIDPAATAVAPVESVTEEVAEPTLAEPLVAGAEEPRQPEAVSVPLALEAPAEPAVVAVRSSSSQSMEVATYGDRLLIRESPGGQVIGSIPNGLKISTIGEKDGWYELESGGWVMARWLRS